MHSNANSKVLVLFIMMGFFKIIVSGQWKSAVNDHEMFDFSIRFQSIKCFVNESRYKLHYCYIKAHSRTLTSVNIALTYLEKYVGPSKVTISNWTFCIMEKKLSIEHFIIKLYLYLLQITVSLHYKFELIFREIMRFTFDYCTLFKNRKFISSNPLYLLVYNSIKDSLPEMFTQGCPWNVGQVT